MRPSAVRATTIIVDVLFSLRTYGANVDELRAPFGDAVALADLEAKLKTKKYKVVTFTHVDTSTGV